MKAKTVFRRWAVVCLALALLASGAAPLFSWPAGVAAAASGPRRQQDDEPDNHRERPRGRIAFAADYEDNSEIYTINPAGGGLSKVTDHPAEDFDPTFAPDGNRLAFVSDRDGNQEIYVVNANGGGETRLTNNAAPDYDPAWSPDGARIAFTSERNGNPDIYVMNADGTGVTRLTTSAGQDFRPTWSPSGNRLAFVSDRDGNEEIYVMNADGTGQSNLTNNPAGDTNPAWSAMRITFQSERDGDDEIFIMNADGGNVVQLTSNTGFDGMPARTADGSRVVFVSDRDGNFDLYSVNADASNPQRLTATEETELDPDVQTPNETAPAGAIQFAAATLTVSEGAGRVTVTVTRTGNTTQAAVVDLATVSGTASDRADFTPVFSNIVFTAGETTKTVTVPIIDDSYVEQNETFLVTLGNPTGANLGGTNTLTVTITDNDSGPLSAGVTFWAVDASNTLRRFTAAAPGTPASSIAIEGLQPGETVVGIDVRPATRQLYAVGTTGRIYVLNPTNGRAILVSTLSGAALTGSSFGVDFNPVPDRLRITSDADQNLRVNVDNGAAVVDGTLAYAAGDAAAGQNPNVVASGYTNSVAGATATTLYNIDSARDTLVTQNPPNNGTLNTVGPLGVNASDVASFDIAPGSNAAYAALNVGGTTGLYTVNLTTGAATLIANIGGLSGNLRGLAVAPDFPNPIDETEFFVRQQYLDFLSREPDEAGLRFWSNALTEQLVRCPATPAADRNRCVLSARAGLSTAFFLSIEFQGTGYFVIRVYQEAFGRLPRLREFLEDMQAIREGVIIGQPGADARLAANRRAFLERFADREEFRARYTGLSDAAYVNALFTNAGVDPASEAATRDSTVAGLANGSETRATALARVAETRAVFNALYNRAFVLMQYFGYLRRNPDDAPDNSLAGFNFWLNKLNGASLPGEDVRDPAVALARIRRADMVEAFIDSIEYRSRFGPA